MAETTPANSLSLSLANFRTMLANVSAWQTWTEADNAAEAIVRIKIGGLPAPREAGQYTLAEMRGYRPYSLIHFDREGGGFQSLALSGGPVPEFQDSGRIMWTVADDIEDEIRGNFYEAEIRFLNSLGAVWDGLKAIGNANPYLSITTIILETGPLRATPSEIDAMGDHIWARMAVEWR